MIFFQLMKSFNSSTILPRITRATENNNYINLSQNNHNNQQHIRHMNKNKKQNNNNNKTTLIGCDSIEIYLVSFSFLFFFLILFHFLLSWFISLHLICFIIIYFIVFYLKRLKWKILNKGATISSISGECEWVPTAPLGWYFASFSDQNLLELM